jgi:ubiquinone biosynthesis protein
VIPQLPRLVHQVLQARADVPPEQNNELLKQLIVEQRRTNVLLGLAVYFGGGLIGGILVAQLVARWYPFFSW